jgi:hypothetical protein
VKTELEQVRSILERLQRKLLHPTREVLDRGTADLTLAADCLKRLEIAILRGHHAGQAAAALHSELAKARRQLTTIQALVEGAGNFHEGWTRLISSVEPTGVRYTAGGGTAAPPVLQPAKVVLHG